MIQHPSDNYDSRNGDSPRMIIIHYTGMMNLQEALDRLTDTNPSEKLGKVSCHYLIAESGDVHQMVDEDNRAWHAGESYWDGVKDINAASIGIELENPGHTLGYSRFPMAQMQSLIALCKDIQSRHNIRPDYVLGHSDIAPERKQDPGELFSWTMMAKQGLSLWPEANARDRQLASVYLSSEQRLRDAFTILGYDPEADIKKIIMAFNRHYNRSDSDALNSAGASKLACLVRTKREILNNK